MGAFKTIARRLARALEALAGDSPAPPGSRTQASEARYRQLLESANSAILRWSCDGRIVYINDYAQRLFGWSAEEAVGRHIGILVPERESTGADLSGLVDDILRRPERYRANVNENLCRDGRRVWMTWTNRAVQDERGQVTEILAIGNDTSEAKRAEAEALAGRAKLQAALASMADAVFISDSQGRFVDFNEAFATYHRFPSKAECAKTLAEYPAILDVFLPDGTLAPLDQWAVPRALRGETVVNAEYGLRRKDTGETWVGSYNFAPLRDPAGTIVGSVVTARDITDRKRAEAEIRRLNADLERLVAERTAELSAANRELESFAYAVSHDLRGPLRAMCGFAGALKEDYGGGLDGEARRCLDEIEGAARHMAELIDAILRLSRSTRGGLSREPVDLSALALRLLGELARAEPGRSVAVEVEPGISVLGDPRMVESALGNLLDNAWKYTGSTREARIRVYAETRGGRPWVAVADNGAGFHMAHGARLFQPFQRLHRQDEFPGIGIGLATVQRIVQRHGGAIEAEGEPGLGAIFRFTLAEATEPGPESGPESGPEAGPAIAPPPAPEPQAWGAPAAVCPPDTQGAPGAP